VLGCLFATSSTCSTALRLPWLDCRYKPSCFLRWEVVKVDSELPDHFLLPVLKRRIYVIGEFGGSGRDLGSDSRLLTLVPDDIELL
jgi:hypothetical protein